MTDRPFTTQEMVAKSCNAIDKIDRNGPRGASYVTWEEIEAMAAMLVVLGVPAVPAGRVLEDPIFVSQRFHPRNFQHLVSEIEGETT